MWDGLNIGQFFCELNASFIIGYFDQELSSRLLSGEVLADKARRLIVQQRREREIDQGEARDLYDEAEEIRHVNSIDHLAGAHYTLMRQLFGDEWWHLDNDATVPNPDWYYLERIIFAVQQALRQNSAAA